MLENINFCSQYFLEMGIIMASPAEKRCVYRRAHRKFQVILKLFLELALSEACLFVGFFKGSTFSTLKRILKNHFTEGFSIKRYFGFLGEVL